MSHPTPTIPVSIPSTVPAPQGVSAGIELLPADPPGLPRLRDLPLPGPRRAKENRGGATSVVTTMRILIRCPLIAEAASIFPAPCKVGRPTPPARYWLFYAALARELASFELADQEVAGHYDDVVVPEFAAQGIRLPRKKPNTTNPVPGYPAYNRWRKEKVIDAGRLAALRAAIMFGAMPLAQAIRDAEGRATGDPLNPSLGETLSGDASVFGPPSDVHTEQVVDENGCVHEAVNGSRARTPGAERFHTPGADYSAVKRHGLTRGLYYVALSSKGYDTYTRVVWDVDVAEEGQAESEAARPMLDGVLAYAPGFFEAVVYDGQIYPKHILEILRRHGVPVINQNGIDADKDDGTDGDAGVTVRAHGQYKDRRVRTHFTPLQPQLHRRADRTFCPHYLVSDDGAVFEADRPALAGGTPKKISGVIVPVALRRTRQGNGDFKVDLDYTIPCEHGDLPYTACLTDSELNRDGGLSWSSILAAHRVIPEAWHDRFRTVFGARNQSEAFFSWLEHRYYIKDRAASWGRDAQLVDLIGAALLANAEAWAHYAYRYGS